MVERPMEPIRDILAKQVIPDRPTSGSDDIPPPEEPVKCIYCKDSGSVYPLLANGKLDYSRTIPCRRCMSEETIRRHLGVSSLGNTFDSFRPVKGAEVALKAAQLIAGLKTTWKLLLIYGRWGNGKTHLLEAISIELWGKGISARVYTFPDFIEKLKNTFDRSEAEPHDQSYRDIMLTYCSMPFLLLDDVGSAGSFTPWSLNQLERIMLARYRDNLFTVITTNMDKTELPEFVVSRFSDTERSRMILNEAGDYRPKKPRKG